MTEITDLTPLTEADDADEMIIYDVSESTDRSKKISIENLFANLVKQEGDATLGDVEVEGLTATVDSLTFESTKVLTNVIAETVSLANGTITAGTAQTRTVTVTGITTSDFLVSFSFTDELASGLSYMTYISDDDEVTVKFFNASSSDASADTHNARVVVLQFA